MIIMFLCLHMTSEIQIFGDEILFKTHLNRWVDVVFGLFLAVLELFASMVFYLAHFVRRSLRSFMSVCPSWGGGYV